MHEGASARGRPAIMISPAEKAELFELLWALCEQSLTPEQRNRLEQLVRGRADARQLYALYMGMVQSLARDQLPRLVRAEQARRSQATDLLTIQAPVVRDTPLDDVTACSLVTKVLCSPVLRRSVAASILLTALAVGMMLAARHFLFTPKNPAEDANSRRFIATLTGTDYCQWGQGTLTTELGSHLKPGTLHLAEGLAEITFQSGV